MKEKNKVTKSVWTVADERKSQVVSRIIPGNWGKVELGWLAQPLLNRIARFGGAETFFDVTIDTFESLPVRVTPVGAPGALRRPRNGSSADSGRGCLGWITVHLGAGTSVLATDRHHRWDVRTDRTHGASAPVIPIFGSGERLRLRIESRLSR
jgi:hypothetical protein